MTLLVTTSNDLRSVVRSTTSILSFPSFSTPETESSQGLDHPLSLELVYYLHINVSLPLLSHVPLAQCSCTMSDPILHRSLSRSLFHNKSVSDSGTLLNRDTTLPRSSSVPVFRSDFFTPYPDAGMVALTRSRVDFLTPYRPTPSSELRYCSSVRFRTPRSILKTLGLSPLH